MSIGRRSTVRRWVAAAAAIALLTLGATASRAEMTFNFSMGSDLQAMASGTPDQQQMVDDVMACFETAAAVWSTRLTDTITVNIDVDFSVLGANTLGSTNSYTLGKDYASVQLALSADATTPDDLTAVMNLQQGGSLDFLTNDTGATGAPQIRDDNGSANNATLDLNRANAKALGLLNARNPMADASIVFSSDITWDLDRGDGIEWGAFDFVGVAVHEIGHVLGFTSGVDNIDYYSAPDGPAGPLDLDDYRVFSALDLYRYSADSLAASDQPAVGAVLDLSTGGESYFSLDAGATELATFSTGRYTGDGYQASHWEDNLYLGVMDPTQTPGFQANITALDLTAMDVIGYDRTPASWGDFNADGVVDVDDIDALAAAVAAGSNETTFDLTFNDIVSLADMDLLLHDTLGTEYGDANLDGAVDIEDFIILKNHFGSENASWADADFDGDGLVNIADFVTLKNYFGFDDAAVPEPTCLALLAAGGLGLLRRRR